MHGSRSTHIYMWKELTFDDGGGDDRDGVCACVSCASVRGLEFTERPATTVSVERAMAG